MYLLIEMIIAHLPQNGIPNTPKRIKFINKLNKSKQANSNSSNGGVGVGNGGKRVATMCAMAIENYKVHEVGERELKIACNLRLNMKQKKNISVVLSLVQTNAATHTLPYTLAHSFATPYGPCIGI